jgi:hypothetical protein
MKVIELFEDAYYAKKMREKDPKIIAKILEKECSTFVNAYRSAHKVIFRGIKELSGDVVFAEALIRPDRVPLFMPKNQHDIINEAMIKLGLKAHRGNSIFCTTYAATASDWGQEYAIFPVDGWVGTVFEKVKTGYVFDKIHDETYDIVQDIHKDITSHEDSVDRVVDLLSRLKPRSISNESGLVTVIKNEYDDILITGKKYYALAMNGYDPKNEANDVFAILGI